MKSTLEQIVNPARAIIQAYERILRVGCDSVYPTFTDQTKSTPYIEFHIGSLLCDGGRQPFKGAKNGIYARWKMQMITKVATSRGINSDEHDKLVDHVIANWTQFWACFGETYLPLHSIEDAKLAGYVVSIQQGDQALNDFTELRHDLFIFLRDNVLTG
jgi:hypothetical protein